MKTEKDTPSTSIFGEAYEHKPVTIFVRGIFSGSLFAVVWLLLACAICAVAGMWNQGIAICFSLIIASLLGGLLQQFWFSYALFVKPSYPMRIAGFGLSYFVVLAFCASIGAWFPTKNLGAWISFIVAYLLILAIITAGFTITFRRQGASYSERLAAYRKQQGK
ncbi:hypothetical protein [Olegusella massiliensis]|uniref:hypothetical protein n=1 Tax=Olegusella massiliensis TaxID=1776381 RepID=UPI0003AE3F19|nr:hypothetical protein [Olegusella massiliensis]ERL11391.1 hypothetical protein HMPREF1248_0440 [Coriobacteriaceae bacterium BV3Ac1]